MEKVRKVFDSPLSGREANRKQLECGRLILSRSVADNAVDFLMLTAEIAWNPEALFDTFLHGVSEEVKDELAAREQLMDLDSLITLTIWIDG